MQLSYVAVLILLAANSNASLCNEDVTQFDNLVCNLVEIAVKKLIPGSGTALFFISKFYSFNDKTAWDGCKKEAESLFQDKIDTSKLQTIENWHSSMIHRVSTCSHKSDVTMKRNCLRNLQEDLSGFEPHFRGSTTKQKAMFLKYYQIYVVTYYAISDMLIKIADTAVLKNSIQKDIKMKSQIFQKYLP